MNPFLIQMRKYTLFQIMKPYTLLPKPKPPPKCPVCKVVLKGKELYCDKTNNKLKKDAAIQKAIKESIEFR